jgi:hypothetical protein
VRTVVGPEGWEAVERAGRRTARHPALLAAARAGYAARGVLYAVVGLLALALAAGAGGRATDSRGALATVAAAPAGRALVALLAVGLAALGAWLVIDAVADTDGRHRRGWKGAAVRVGRAISGLVHGSLALAAVRLALARSPGPGGDEVARSWTARALELPAGRVLVFAGGAIAIALGARRIWSGLRRSFLRDLDLSRAGSAIRTWASRAGMAGVTTQGAVFALVGVFFAQAAFERDPAEAAGFDGALGAIARQPYGVALLAAVAVGLVAYAAYSFIEGAHRKLGGG